MNTLSRRNAGKEKESLLFVGAIVALFLVINILLAYFASSFGWYFLATDRMYYDLSGVTDEYFSAVNPENKRVEFYFCMSEEGLTENPTFGRIYDTVKQFDQRYDFFSVTHLRTDYHHELLERFTKDADGNTVELSTQSVIIYSPDTGRHEVRSLSTFYYYDTEDTTNDDMIFNGEEVVSALVGAVVLETRPTALFTIGHGEAPTLSLTSAIGSAGFALEQMDISKGDIPEGTELVVIASPRYDFEEYADASIACELSRLRKFIAGGGTVLYLRNTGAGALPRLEKLFSDHGITAEAGIISDATYSVDLSAKAVLLRFDGGEGARAVRAYAQKYNDSPLVAAGVSPLTLTEAGGATVVPLLRSHETAVNAVNGETVSQAGKGGYVVSALATLAPNDEGKSGHLALIAAEAFADVDTMETDGYANKEFIYSLLAETTGASSPIGCGVVMLNTYPLEGMTRGTAGVFLAVFAGAVPLCVAVTGVIVLRRRRLR